MLSRGPDVPYLRFRPTEQAPPESTQLEAEGWALLPGVLSEQEVTALAADISRVYDQWPPDARRPQRAAEEFEQFRYEMLNRSAVCQAVVGNRRILDVIEPLLGEDCHVIANTAWRNPAETEHTHGGGRWHIDAGPHIPLPPGIDWDERIPHPVFAVACHVLLQDCPSPCGPTSVIPRSHLSGAPPPADRLDDTSLSWHGHEPVVLAAAAGDVQLFVSDVWHRRMPTSAGDAGRFFLQVHYGRRDIAQRLQTTAVANQVSDEAIGRATTVRDKTLIGLHRPLFYDGWTRDIRNGMALGAACLRLGTPRPGSLYRVAGFGGRVVSGERVMDELVDFYGRYIAAFNDGDRAGFAAFFHLPLTVVHASRYDERHAGRALSVVTDVAQLWAPLPDHWARTSIDAVIPLADAAPFAPHAELVERSELRPGLIATVTRWHTDGAPYEHLHVLYLLTREAATLGIKVLVELSAATRATNRPETRCP